MTTRTIALPGLPELTVSRRSLAYLGMLAALVAVTIGAAHVAKPIYFVMAAILVAAFGYVTFRSPRLVLLVVAFLPLVDRYLIAGMVPPSLSSVSTYFSESALAVASLVILYLGVRSGRLLEAFRHPAFVLLVGFGMVGVISAIVNRVPPVVAGAGIVFTVDAAALFFLPRITGFGPRQARIVVIAFVAVATVAAVLALLQVVLSPTILGLGTLGTPGAAVGRFGEGIRVGSFLADNPNMLGALLAMAIPFPVFGFFRANGGRRWVLALVAFLLTLALFFTFSRGAWIGLAAAMVVSALVLDRRALVALAVLVVLTYGTAHFMPHNLLATDAERAQLEFDLQQATLGRLGAIGSGDDLRTLFIENALPIIKDHPVIGAGPGRYGGAVAAHFGSPLNDEYTAGKVPLNRTVDNFWLHILVEFGVLGTLLLIGAFVAIARELFLAARLATDVERAMYAGFVAVGIVLGVDSVTEMLLEGNTTSFIMWLLLGIGSALALSARSRVSEAASTAADAARRSPGQQTHQARTSA